MPRRKDISKILVIGSGQIVIGQDGCIPSGAKARIYRGVNGAAKAAPFQGKDRRSDGWQRRVELPPFQSRGWDGWASEDVMSGVGF
jgi:hypothetical protein